MKIKFLQVRLDEETHKTLKSKAAEAAETLPEFTSKVISEAIKNQKVFTK